jgi:DNA-directed RNA polymerase specialized sigma subunit
MSNTYRVVVTREDNNWLAEVPQLEGTRTYAKTLRKLDEYVREAVVLGADLPDEAMADLDLDYEYHLGNGDLDLQVRELRQARRELAERQAVVDRITRLLVREAGRSLHLSQRDVAAIVGVSHQRVDQLQERAEA